jgi:hypothetical protein
MCFNALNCMSSRFHIDLLQGLFSHKSCIVFFSQNKIALLAVVLEVANPAILLNFFYQLGSCNYDCSQDTSSASPVWSSQQSLD